MPGMTMRHVHEVRAHRGCGAETQRNVTSVACVLCGTNCAERVGYDSVLNTGSISDYVGVL
jgi:hypothetical protein